MKIKALWAVSSDFIYMKLKQALKTSKLIKEGSTTMKELAWKVDGLKHIVHLGFNF